MLPGVYYYYPVTSIGKHTTYTVRDYDTRHTRASTAPSAAVALMSRAVCISITQPLNVGLRQLSETVKEPVLWTQDFPGFSYAWS